MTKFTNGTIVNRPSTNQPGNPGQPPMPKHPHQKIVVMVSDVDNHPEKTMTKKIAKTPAKQGSKVAKKLAAKTAAKKTALKKVVTKTSAGLTDSQVNATMRGPAVTKSTPAQRKKFNDAVDALPKTTVALDVKDGKVKDSSGTVNKLSAGLRKVGDANNAQKTGRGLTAPVIHIDAAGFLPAKPKALVSKHVQIDFSKGKQLVGRTLAQATRGLKAYVVATHAESKADYVFSFSALSDKPAVVKATLRKALAQRGFTVKAITV